MKQLATGDVADVLLARATGLEGFARHVVIKCIRPELAGEQRLVEAFIEEARIAAALHHQNIVQVHDIGEQDGAYYFAMEYVHGEDVLRLLGKVREREEQVPLDHVVAIISATAAGLHHAHEQRSPAGEPLGLVHRDVCPANILLGYDGSVKLVDFGMAKAALRSVKTASGSLKGKASYMSPEQCMGKPVDRRTDTFALGIVLYELATARRLFKGANEFMTMAAIVEGDVPPPSAYRTDLPKSLDEIVMRALAREPEARYQSAEDLRAALERFAIDQQLRTSNKALADFFLALFGQRLEPWHGDSEVRAVAADFDNTSGKGLVAAPEVDVEQFAKHGTRSTAPIMLAQTLVQEADKPVPSVDDEWSDDDEHVRTTARPSKLMAAVRAVAAAEAASSARADAATPIPGDAATVIPGAAATPIPGDAATVIPGDAATAIPGDAPTPIPGDAATVIPGDTQIPDEDDLFGRTIVAPPEFEPEESTAAHDEKAEEAAEVLARARARNFATEPVEQRGRTIAGMGVAAPREVTPRARLPSEHRYVGPPAPRPPFLQRFLGTYRQSILIGAAAGVLAVAIVVLAMRACQREPVPRPPRGSVVTPATSDAAVIDAGTIDAPPPPKKKPAGKKTAGSRSSR